MPDPSPSVRRAEAAPAPAATNAPSAIGSLVASFGVLELGKLLAGESGTALLGRELYLDARHHRFYPSRLLRNPRCRFDHRTWAVSEAGGAGHVTLADALRLGGGAAPACELRVEGDAFVGRLRCRRCGRGRAVWKLRRRLGEAERRCEGCGASLRPTGFALIEGLSGDRVPAGLLDRPLARFGLRAGEIFAIRTGAGETHHQLALAAAPASDSRPTVVLAGCGNIGSHVVPHLAREPGLGRVLLIDPDVYEPRNLAGQDIRASDVRRRKVDVQAERLRAIRPELEVVAVADRLERLPLGHFRGAVLLGALDSRLARQQLNQAAWRTGSPWIDMAVDGAALLCRVTVHVPGCESPCLECGWDADDYRSLRQALPCEESSGQQRGERSDSGAD